MPEFKESIVKALEKAISLEEFSAGEISSLLETPPQPELGDYAFPCFKLAAALKKTPQEIASDLSKKISLPKEAEKVQAVGPYINFFLSKGLLAENTIARILKEKENYGKGNDNRTVLTEFCHANTHKAFHIGHVRNISLGESLSRIFEFNGCKVIRTNYQGDVGPHVSKCLWGYMNFFKDKEPVKDKGKWLGEIYAFASKKVKENPELEQTMRDLVKKLFEGDKELTALWKKTRQWSLDYFEEIYKDFGVKYDRLYFESEMERRGREIARELLNKGIAVESEGAIIMDLEKYGLGVFIILKNDDMPLYSTKDLALAEKKFNEFKVDEALHIVGSEQKFYFKQLFKTFELMKFEEAEKSRHLAYELVMLKEGKMASREGKVIVYSELLEKMMEKILAEVRKHHSDWSEEETLDTTKEISLAAIKFGMLNQDTNKVIRFDWEKALELEGETGPYIQYSYARAKSILRKVEEKNSVTDYSLLSQETEKKLISLLFKFPETISQTANHLSPHILAQHLLDIASVFNSFYHDFPVLKANPGIKEARIALVEATAIVLKNGFNLLGITALEEM